MNHNNNNNKNKKPLQHSKIYQGIFTLSALKGFCLLNHLSFDWNIEIFDCDFSAVKENMVSEI